MPLYLAIKLMSLMCDEVCVGKERELVHVLGCVNVFFRSRQFLFLYFSSLYLARYNRSLVQTILCLSRHKTIGVYKVFFVLHHCLSHLLTVCSLCGMVGVVDVCVWRGVSNARPCNIKFQFYSSLPYP